MEDKIIASFDGWSIKRFDKHLDIGKFNGVNVRTSCIIDAFLTDGVRKRKSLYIHMKVESYCKYLIQIQCHKRMIIIYEYEPYIDEFANNVKELMDMAKYIKIPYDDLKDLLSSLYYRMD